MRNLFATMVAGSLSAVIALSSTAPVQAMPFQAITGAEQKSNAQRVDVENIDWRDHRHRWDRGDDHRDNWRRYNGSDRYHSHHHSNGAAIIGGLAAGAIIGGAIANSNNHSRYYYHNGRRYLRD